MNTVLEIAPLETEIDSAQITQTLRLFHSQGELFEIRVPSVYSGFFSDPLEAVNVIRRIDSRAKGIYHTLNPISPALFRNNQWQGIGKATGDIDILGRHWLPIDFDPIRPTDTSSTDNEKQLAHDKALEVKAFLSSLGFPEPITGHSGNGYHLTYRIEMPTKDNGVIEKCLAALDFLYSDGIIKIDIVNANASRIWKLYGTWARKGLNTIDRPHRLSKLVNVPETIVTVTIELLKKLAGYLPNPETESENFSNSFDIADWIAKYELDVRPPKPWKTSGKAWIFNACPWNKEHTDHSAYIVQFPKGAIQAGCHHNGCIGKKWKDLRSLYEPGRETPQYKLTESGNADRLASKYGNVLKYTDNSGWLTYDGKKWTANKNLVYQFAQKTVRGIHDELSTIDDDDDRKALFNWAQKSESKYGLESMVTIAKTNKTILSDITQFDTNPMLLNVSNGTIDLTNGKLQPHNPADKITKCSNVSFDSSATCPNFMAFLEKVFRGNPELIHFVQLALGYSLTGKIGEKCLFFLSGPEGDNGKTTFTQAIQGVLNSYYQSMQANTLLKKKFEAGINNDIARTKGARVIVCPEMPKGESFNEERIKSLTGGDTITARFLYQESFDFRLEAKIWLVGNDKPAAPDDDKAFWTRMKVIPFDYKFSSAEIERDFYQNRLEPELSGILNWAIAGCLEWQQTGLIYPEVIERATANYRDENDSVTNFINECCLLDKSASIRSNELYHAYKFYCTSESCHIIGSKTFSQKVSKQAHITKRRTETGFEFVGIRLAESQNTNTF